MPVDSVIHPPVQKSLTYFSRPVLSLAAILFLFLIIFVSKPVHIDDPVFLKTADHLLKNPLDPFGARINWSGVDESIFNEDNPFLLPYYFALVMGVFGDSEWILHAACMIFPILSLFVFAGIAGVIGKEPWMTAGLLVSSPAFLVSSTTLMGDIPLSAFYMLACFCYLRLIETGKSVFGWWMAVFIVLASFTKYIGLSLIPLFLLDSLLRRAFRQTVRYLVIPVIAFCAWCFHNVAATGAIHAWDAGRSMNFGAADVFRKMIASFSFAGLSILGFTIFVLLRARRLAISWMILASISFLLISSSDFVVHTWNAVLMSMGIASALVGFYCAAQKKNTLLLIWFAGMLIYSWLSEFVAARVVLLFAPPLILLLTREIGKKSAIIAIALNFAFGFWITAEDTHLARLYKRLAESMPVQNSHYVAHWGFQHYMEKRGLPPFDYRNDRLEKGDMIIVPFVAGTSFHPMPSNSGVYRNAEIRLVMEAQMEPHRGMFVMNQANDSGLYCHGWGMLPFAFGTGPLETLRYFRVVSVH